MRITFTFCKMLLTFLLFSQFASAQSVGDYQSASTGDWTTTPATRWDVWDGDSWEDAVTAPNSSSGVITILSGHTITVGLAAVTADQIVVAAGGALTLTGSALTLDDGAGNDLEVDGTLNQGNSISVGTGTPNVQVDGTWSWTGGTLSVPTVNSAGATLTLNAPGTLATTLTNDGTVDWTGNNLSFTGGTFTNNATFTATGNNAFNNISGTNALVNSATGTMTKNTGVGTTTIGVPFTNSGILTITTGTITSSVNGSFTNSGTVNFNSTTLSLAGGAATSSFDPGTALNGTGTLTINGNTDINVSPLSLSTITLNLGSQTLGGTGTLDHSGTMNWTGGTLDVSTTINVGGTLNITASVTLTGTLTNNGTLNWTGGLNLNFNNGTLNNNSTLTTTINGFFTQAGGTNSFVNDVTGTFTKNTLGGTTSINIPFTNAGTINVTTGTISSTGASASFTNSGTINFNSTTFIIAGTVGGGSALNAGTTFTGTGTLSITANTAISFALDLPSTVTLTLATGTLSGGGSLEVNGAMTWNSGTVSIPLTIDAAATLTLSTGSAKALNAGSLTNNGTVNWTGGAINFTNGTLTNAGTLTASTDATMANTSGTNSFVNTNIFTKSAGAGNTTLAIPVTNSGTINVNSGTVLKTVTAMTNTGAIVLSSGTFSNSTGAVTYDPGTTITGTGNFQSSGVSTINEDLVLPSGVVYDYNTGASILVASTGSVTVEGTFNWNSVSAINVPFTIAVGATANAVTGTKFAAAPFTNNGTLNLGNITAVSIGSASFPTVTFTNNGTINETFVAANVNVATGGGAGTKTFLNTGTINKTTVNTLSFTTVTVNNSGSLDGIGTYSFTTITPNTGNINPGPGTPPGILAMTPNALGTNTPNVRIHVVDGSGAGTGHDRLDLSGTTTLTNTNLIVTENSAAPLQSYIIMTAPNDGATTFGFLGTFASVNMTGAYSLAIDNSTDPATVTITKNLITLPVNWGTFTALARNNKVDLKWTTLQEVNTTAFILEHSVDGRQFTAIGSVPAAGNSNVATEYAFSHAQPNLSKLNYYRIQQKDADGRTSYSVIRSVKFSNGKVVAVQATPNPVQNVLQLSVQLSNIRVVLSDLNGKAVRSMNLQPGVHTLNVQDLPKGIYQLTVYQNQERIEAQQIVKL